MLPGVVGRAYSGWSQGLDQKLDAPGDCDSSGMPCEGMEYASRLRLVAIMRNDSSTHGSKREDVWYGRYFHVMTDDSIEMAVLPAPE
jgi:hypothetical protein